MNTLRIIFFIIGGIILSPFIHGAPALTLLVIGGALLWVRDEMMTLQGRIDQLEEELHRQNQTEKNYASKTAIPTAPTESWQQLYSDEPNEVIDSSEESLSMDVPESMIPNSDNEQRYQPGYGVKLSEEISSAITSPETMYAVSDELIEEPQGVIVEQGPSVTDKIVAWLLESWPLKLGALLIILAIGWFVSFAFANDWIAPWVRIMMGLVFGISLMGCAFWWMKKYVQQGAVVLLVGASAVILTLLAALQLFGFFTPVVILLLMLLTMSFVAFTSGVYRIKSLSYLSLISGMIFPVLIGTSPDATISGLFMYLLIVLVGNVGLSFWTNIPGLVPTGALMLGFYTVTVYGQTEPLLPLFIILQGILLFVTGTIFIVRSTQSSDTLNSKDYLQAGAFGVVTTVSLMVGWIVTTVPSSLQVGSLLGMMLVTVFTGIVLYQKTAHKLLFYIYGMISFSLLVLATMIQFEGVSLVNLLAIEFALMIVLMQMIGKNIYHTARFSYILLFPIFLLIPIINSNDWLNGAIHISFWTMLVVGLILIALGFYLYPSAQKYPKKEESAILNPAMQHIIWLFVSGIAVFQVLVMQMLYGGLLGEIPNAALLFIFIISSVGILYSLIYQKQGAAYTLLIVQMGVPLFMYQTIDITSVFIYLFVVGWGSIGLSYISDRAYFSSVSMGLILLNSLIYINSGTRSITLFILLIGAAYLFTAIFQYYRSLSTQDLGESSESFSAASLTLIFHSIWSTLWIVGSVPDSYRIWLLLGLTVIYVFIGFFLFSLQKSRKVFFIFSTIGLALTVLATSIQFEGLTATLFMTIQLAIMPLLVHIIFDDIKLTQKYNYLMLLPILWSTESLISLDWRTGVFHGAFMNLLVLIGILFGLGLTFYSASQKSDKPWVKSTNTTLLVGGSIYAYILIWLALGASNLNAEIAVFISLTIYTLVGILCYMYGLNERRSFFQKYGAIVFSAVVVRLILIDVWAMGIIPRVLTFFVIGLLLMSTTFLHRSAKQDTE